MSPPAARTLLAIALLAALGCDFDSDLAPRQQVAVVVDASGVLRATTDLGYDVEPTRCRAAIADLQFSTEGEQHASLGGALMQTVIGTAWAHPGHQAGGEVVGELPGRFVFDWRADGQPLGDATMLHAKYTGANFSFTRARPRDGLALDDPLIGHTFEIAGVASRGERTWTFEALIDQDEDREIIGAPVDVRIDGSTEPTLGLVLGLGDPFAHTTAFDGLDFAVLDDDGDGHVVLHPDTDAYNLLRRRLQVHDRYWASNR